MRKHVQPDAAMRPDESFPLMGKDGALLCGTVAMSGRCDYNEGGLAQKGRITISM